LCGIPKDPGAPIETRQSRHRIMIAYHDSSYASQLV